MALSLETPKTNPPIMIIYGPEGLGKSTFGANMPKPVFIQTENGLTAINAPRFPVAKDFKNFMGFLRELATQDHDFKTVVIDSLDWLEPLVWAETVERNPYGDKGRQIENIEDYGYGKGYALALDVWTEYLNALNFLRDKKNMVIVQTAHDNIKNFKDPLNESYDRYSIKLQKDASAKVQEHADIVFFLNSYVATTKKKEGFGSERVIGVGSGDRILHTERQAGFNAKNRYGLPSEIPYDKEGKYMDILKQHIQFFKPAKKEKTND